MYRKDKGGTVLKRPSSNWRITALIFLLFTLLACSKATNLNQTDPSNFLINTLKSSTWNKFLIKTPEFSLLAAGPSKISSKTLRVYIEGDGHAWENRNTPSTDPTPLNPISFQLALADPSLSAVYLSRPCQYPNLASSPNCNVPVWTNARFSEKVVRATNEAINQLKVKYAADQVVLIGYSGGGTIAALCASTRKDVVLLVTVAGNLNTTEWVDYHRLSPLAGSINPVEAVESLKNIKQIHYVGSEDDVVPIFLTEDFVNRFPSSSRPIIKIEKGFGHSAGWVKNWGLIAP